jgi:hypothetical protein
MGEEAADGCQIPPGQMKTYLDIVTLQDFWDWMQVRARWFAPHAPSLRPQASSTLCHLCLRIPRAGMPCAAKACRPCWDQQPADYLTLIFTTACPLLVSACASLCRGVEAQRGMQPGSKAASHPCTSAACMPKRFPSTHGCNQP